MTAWIGRDVRRARIRIVGFTVLALVAIVVVAGLVIVGAFERALTSHVDSRLELASEYLGRIDASGVDISKDEVPNGIVQAIDAEGAVEFASPELDGLGPLWMPGDDVGFRTVSVPEVGDLRILPVAYRGRWVVFAEPLAPVADSTTTLERTFLYGLPALVLALSGLVWFVAGRTLRPVVASMEREDRLVADVSHELRSPLAGLRVLLETERRDPDAVELSRLEALSAVTRLEAITNQLLVLNRQDGRTNDSTTREPIDLDEIVENEVRALGARAVPVTIDADRVGPGQIMGDDGDLTSLVQNLLTNAVRHAHTKVAVGVVERNHTVALTVDDDGPGIDPADRGRVFDRFARLDDARSRDQGGAGLGLSIAKAIVDAHGGTITVDDSALGGASFQVQLPASTPE
jgi:signal transduction histidine kinase